MRQYVWITYAHLLDVLSLTVAQAYLRRFACPYVKSLQIETRKRALKDSLLAKFQPVKYAARARVGMTELFLTLERAST
jgi:hypothetical protein